MARRRKNGRNRPRTPVNLVYRTIQAAGGPTAVCRALGIPVEKVVRNIERYGNTTAASIPIALDETVKAGRLKTGDLLVLTAFGSGFTWASAAIRW